MSDALKSLPDEDDFTRLQVSQNKAELFERVACRFCTWKIQFCITNLL